MLSKLGIKADVETGFTGIAIAVLCIIAIMNKSKVTSREFARGSGATDVDVRNRFGRLDDGLNLGLR